MADAASAVYTSIHLDELGLSRTAFELAWKGYSALLEKQQLGSCRYLSICDFSQSSRKKRLYIIDVEQQKLVFHTLVAHGKNSGAEYATRFSNKPESLQSSLGFYITGSTYMGKHGLSLKMQGMEPGINDKAMQRAIVIHGAEYVNMGRVNAGSYIGRSWGCPAVAAKEANSIINTIKNGSCLFIYHPAKEYTEGSTLLND